LHFGLAAATRIDKLEVKWPGGLMETVNIPRVDTVVTVVEGKGVASK